MKTVKVSVKFSLGEFSPMQYGISGAEKKPRKQGLQKRKIIAQGTQLQACFPNL